MFWKQNSFSDDSKGTSTQTVVNNVESEDERSVSINSKRNSIQSNWSELLLVDKEAEYKRTCRSEPNFIGVATTSTTIASAVATTEKSSIPPMKKTVKNIVLVPYTPKPTDWGSWRIRSPYATSTIASPPMAQSSEQRKEEGEMVYEPHSPYYSPVHPPEFYEDE